MPDLPEAIFPFETRSASTEWRATYFVPAIRSRERNLSLRLSLLWRDLENRVTDFPRDSFNPVEEHVRILQPRFTYDRVGRHNGIWLVDARSTSGWMRLAPARIPIRA